MRRYMQLAYLFHWYAKSLLSTDGRIADCTVRHPGVERPFSSVINCGAKYLFDDDVMSLKLFIVAVSQCLPLKVTPVIY